MLPLFNASLFLTYATTKFEAIRTSFTTMQLCNTERCGQTTLKWISPVYETDRKSIWHSEFLILCSLYSPLREFMSVSSVENFATLQLPKCSQLLGSSLKFNDAQYTVCAEKKLALKNRTFSHLLHSWHSSPVFFIICFFLKSANFWHRWLQKYLIEIVCSGNWSFIALKENVSLKVVAGLISEQKKKEK